METISYLQEKKIEMESILSNKDWGQIQDLYIEMESDGYGEYVVNISELMTSEDVIEYRDWDKKINGSIEAQTDDNS